MVARVDHKAALAGLAGQPAHGGVEDAPVAALCAHPDLYRLSAVWMLAGRLERLLSVEYVLGMEEARDAPAGELPGRVPEHSLGGRTAVPEHPVVIDHDDVVGAVLGERAKAALVLAHCQLGAFAVLGLP